jgi:hypothetical protein
VFKFNHTTRNEAPAGQPGLDAGDARIAAPIFEIQYQNTVQPSPGAMAYAFESLALTPYPVSGPTVATRRPINPTAQPMYVLQSVPLVGLSFGGTVAGQLVTQPLFNPYGGGYSGEAPTQFAFAPNAVDPLASQRRTM